MDLGLAGANVVIAGGTRGMGLAAAECFAADGANVAVLARGRDALDEAEVRLSRLGSPHTLPIETDLRDEESIQRAFALIAEEWDGTVNTLVNAVGPVEVGQGTIEQLPDQEWFDTFEIGAMSAVRCVRACLPLLRAAAWARIVNVSAHSTKRQTAGLVAYTAAKSAMTSVSKNLSLHLAAEEILVNTVSPGTFMTAGLAGFLDALPEDRRVDQSDLYAVMRLIDREFGHPAQMPRVGLPEEIGAVIAFVGSRRNSYMTGANINVDGGSDFC